MGWMVPISLLAGGPEPDPQRRLGPDGGLHILGADEAVGGDGQVGHFKALALQRLHAVQHGMMLELRGDEVLLALLGQFQGRALDGPVVGLGAAAGEEDLAGLAVDGLGHLSAAGVHKFLGFVANAVMAGGVAAGAAQGLGDHFQNFRGHRGGGGVIQIYNFFHDTHLASCKKLWGEAPARLGAGMGRCSKRRRRCGGTLRFLPYPTPKWWSLQALTTRNFP